MLAGGFDSLDREYQYDPAAFATPHSQPRTAGSAEQQQQQHLVLYGLEPATPNALDTEFANWQQQQQPPPQSQQLVRGQTHAEWLEQKMALQRKQEWLKQEEVLSFLPLLI
jgi:hypothetical protein